MPSANKGIEDSYRSAESHWWRRRFEECLRSIAAVSMSLRRTASHVSHKGRGRASERQLIGPHAAPTRAALLARLGICFMTIHEPDGRRLGLFPLMCSSSAIRSFRFTDARISRRDFRGYPMEEERPFLHLVGISQAGTLYLCRQKSSSSSRSPP
jgi:hypothetical protein